MNINSVRNKFEALVELVSTNLDVLMISGTKIEEPNSGTKIPSIYY